MNNNIDISSIIKDSIMVSRETNRERSDQKKVYLTNRAPVDMLTKSVDGSGWLVSDSPLQIQLTNDDTIYDVQADWIVLEATRFPMKKGVQTVRDSEEKQAAAEKLRKMQKKAVRGAAKNKSFRIQMDKLRKKAFEETPPGREDQVKKLKKAIKGGDISKTYKDSETGEEKESNPYALAWASYNKESSIDNIIDNVTNDYLGETLVEFQGSSYDVMAYDPAAYSNPYNAFMELRNTSASIKKHNTIDKQTIRQWIRDVYKGGNNELNFKEFVKFLVKKGVKVTDRRENRIGHLSKMGESKVKLKEVLTEGMGDKFIEALSKDAKTTSNNFKKMISDERVSWKYTGATNVGIFVDGKQISSVGPKNAMQYGLGKKGYHTHKDAITSWAEKIGMKQYKR